MATALRLAGFSVAVRLAGLAAAVGLGFVGVRLAGFAVVGVRFAGFAAAVVAARLAGFAAAVGLLFAAVDLVFAALAGVFTGRSAEGRLEGLRGFDVVVTPKEVSCPRVGDNHSSRCFGTCPGGHV
ncbi:hypothetical protein [Nannocystis bainbridge]|uniref:Uncharacterized protein n=1 Tax=Nannocystis bainbridge TaxID=2995303 RepID=A0ABT5DWQ6_9BACT|nr:hypothetical protein [Nannocystis bainbridge]MDC0717575.1 hypothetical protein [Nannocystis bainbridge]